MSENSLTVVITIETSETRQQKLKIINKSILATEIIKITIAALKINVRAILDLCQGRNLDG